jgi:hypothetical protein
MDMALTVSSTDPSLKAARPLHDDVDAPRSATFHLFRPMLVDGQKPIVRREP